MLERRHSLGAQAGSKQKPVFHSDESEINQRIKRNLVMPLQGFGKAQEIKNPLVRGLCAAWERNQLTLSRSALPALNLGTLAAGI